MPSVLNIKIDSATNGSIEISKKIKTEKMRLKSYRVEFDSAANANLAQYITFTTPWINSAAITSGYRIGATQTPSIDGLILPLDDQEITTYSVDINFDVSAPITSAFTYNLFGENNLDGFQGMILIFEYDSPDDLA